MLRVLSLVPLALVTLVALAVFMVFPQVDLLVSRLFYLPGLGFVLEENALCLLVYRSVYALTTFMVIAVVSALLLHAIQHWRPLPPRITAFLPNLRVIAFLAITLTFGPGLLVHEVVKEVWERPRPRHTQEFGGKEPFNSIYSIPGTGGKSFISGHSAMGFWTVALAFVVSRRRREAVFYGGLFYGVVVALGRIMQGGHYLSDVTFGALSSLWLIYLIGRWLLPEVRYASAPD